MLDFIIRDIMTINEWKIILKEKYIPHGVLQFFYDEVQVIPEKREISLI